MTKFDKNGVWDLFESNLKEAKGKLATLKVYCGREPCFTGLSDWVFEQTIQHCIREEFAATGTRADIAEQVSLGGKRRADLTIGKVAVEIKTSGLFSHGEVQRYGEYRKAAEARGFKYVFLSWGETYQPYRDGIIKELGKDNVFYINETGEWERFVHMLNGQK